MSELDEAREKTHQQWLDGATVAGWRKWSSKLAVQSRAATEAIVQAAHISAGMRILDLASGSGEPALTLAEGVGPSGHVTATDWSPGMLSIAEDLARVRGLTNVSFHTADAESLPFEDESFDRVTCRFGAMFFPDAHRAFSELRRVLRPEGWTSMVVWTEPGQLAWGALFGTLSKFVSLPRPPPNAPGLFRFAEPLSLTHALESAGLREVKEEPRTFPWVFPGSPEDCWQSVHDLAAPIRPLIDRLPADQRDRLKSEMVEQGIGYRMESCTLAKTPSFGSLRRNPSRMDWSSSRASVMTFRQTPAHGGLS